MLIMLRFLPLQILDMPLLHLPVIFAISELGYVLIVSPQVPTLKVSVR